MDHQFQTIEATWFNKGCDARLRGVSLEDCPSGEVEEVKAWRRGWQHCQTYWGVDARIPPPPLRQIQSPKCLSLACTSRLRTYRNLDLLAVARTTDASDEA